MEALLASIPGEKEREREGERERERGEERRGKENESIIKLNIESPLPPITPQHMSLDSLACCTCVGHDSWL